MNEYDALVAVADDYAAIVSEVEELVGVDILTDDCDLAKMLPQFKKSLANLAKIQGK